MCYSYTHQETTIAQDAAKKKQMGNKSQELKLIEKADKVVVRVPGGKTSTKPKEQAKKGFYRVKESDRQGYTTHPTKQSKTKIGLVQNAGKKVQKSALIAQDVVKEPEAGAGKKATEKKGESQG